jgi:hypothetical protein
MLDLQTHEHSRHILDSHDEVEDVPMQDHNYRGSDNPSRLDLFESANEDDPLRMNADQERTRVIAHFEGEDDPKDDHQEAVLNPMNPNISEPAPEVTQGLTRLRDPRPRRKRYTTRRSFNFQDDEGSVVGGGTVMIENNDERKQTVAISEDHADEDENANEHESMSLIRKS